MNNWVHDFETLSESRIQCYICIMQIIRLCSKDEKNKKGIYKITNSFNNKIYIGSASMSFRLRWNQHSCSLFGNNHHNNQLQNAFNKYNCIWTFEIIEIIDNNQKIRTREAHWINVFKKHKIKLFNTADVSENDLFIHSSETKKLISLNRSGINKGILPSNLKSLHLQNKRAIVEKENGKIIKEYDSATEAGISLNISHKIINSILCGKSIKCRKYPNKIWEYKDGKPANKQLNRKSSAIIKEKIPILMYDDKVLIKKYSSADEIAIEFGISPGNVRNMCRNPKQINRKFKFKLKYDRT